MESNANPNMDGVEGWAGYQATISAYHTRDARDVALVTATGPMPYVIYEADPQTPTQVGQQFKATALVVAWSQTAVGRPVRVFLREKRTNGTLVQDVAGQPVTLAADWREATGALVAREAGSVVDVRVKCENGAAGDQFGVDYCRLEPGAVVEPGPEPPPTDTGYPTELRPYGDAAPWYWPVNPKWGAVHSGAVLDSFKNAVRRRQTNLSTRGEGPSLYVGHPSDPVHQLAVAGQTYRFFAPDGMLPGGGSDNPLLVYNPQSPDHGPHVSFRVWKLRNVGPRRWTGSGYGITHYGHDQAGVGHAFIGQNTGSGCNYDCGIVHKKEITDGAILHTLRAACINTAKSYRWPAIRSDGGLGQVEMGTRFVAEYDWTHLQGPNATATRAARIIGEALVKYGLHVLDSGSGGLNLYFESQNTAGSWDNVLGCSPGQMGMILEPVLLSMYEVPRGALHA